MVPYLYLLGKWRLKDFCSREFLRPSLPYSFCFVLFLAMCFLQKGFPCGSAGEESTCNVGNLGSIPGLGRSPGEGNGYPLQYSGLKNSINCIVHGWQRVGHNWVTFTFTSFKSTRLLIWVFPVNFINDQWPYPKFKAFKFLPVQNPEAVNFSDLNFYISINVYFYFQTSQFLYTFTSSL